MWDEVVLRQLNQQAFDRFLELSNKERTEYVPVVQEKREVKPLPVFPLSILARKLIGGPPSLAYFVELLEMGETATMFRDMVREYLPEHEANIYAQDLNCRATEFCRIFSQYYFPLDEAAYSEDFTIDDLVSRIPWQPMGFSYESWHEFTEFRDGFILALSLLECQWDDEEEEEESGARVVILERVGELVGEGLPRLIPPGGWSSEEMHELVDGTEFAGLGLFADWVFNETGCIHLDEQGASLEMGESIDWSPGEVEALTSDWHQSCEIMDRLHQLALLLENDMERTFRRLMALLLNNQDLIIAKEQLPLPLD